MITALIVVDSLGLKSIETEQMIESINLITALIYSPTLSLYLLLDSLEMI